MEERLEAMEERLEARLLAAFAKMAGGAPQSESAKAAREHTPTIPPTSSPAIPETDDDLVNVDGTLVSRAAFLHQICATDRPTRMRKALDDSTKVSLPKEDQRTPNTCLTTTLNEEVSTQHTQHTMHEQKPEGFGASHLALHSLLGAAADTNSEDDTMWAMLKRAKDDAGKAKRIKSMEEFSRLMMAEAREAHAKGRHDYVLELMEYATYIQSLALDENKKYALEYHSQYMMLALLGKAAFTDGGYNPRAHDATRRALKGKGEATGDKYCSKHGHGTHATKDCRQVKKEKAAAADGSSQRQGNAGQGNGRAGQ